VIALPVAGDDSLSGATATGMKSVAHRVAAVPPFRRSMIHRQEVRPMNAVSAVGAPLQFTIARLN
jgi:hypothetical protein